VRNEKRTKIKGASVIWLPTTCFQVSEWIQKYFHLTCDMKNVKQSIALNWL